MFRPNVVRTAAALTFIIPAVTTQAAAQTAPAQESFFALLNGNNECDDASPPVCQRGDPRAYGSVVVTLTSATSLCFAIVLNRVTGTPTDAHLHAGNATVRGPVVVALTAPAAGNPGTSSGCVTGLTNAVVNGIRNNPQAHYINIHDTRFPSGTMRGQLF